jgi:molybdopterin-guanine dinucleotide biosynthesis protein A
MGRDKASLPLPGGKQLATRHTFAEQLGTLLAGCCQEVVMVAREPEQSSSLHLSPSIRIVFDEVPDQGPLMGLYSGLRAIRGSHALVVAVDMPFVLPELLSFLLAQPLDDAMVVPLVGDIAQVLLAIYPRSLLPLIEDRLQDGRRDPRALLEVGSVRYVEEGRLREVDGELRSFVNLNTPEEMGRYGL